MLSDSSNEIRQQADSAPSEFLQEIKSSQFVELQFDKKGRILGEGHVFVGCQIQREIIIVSTCFVPPLRRFEKGMVGLSFCDFVGTREEKVKMAEYRKSSGLDGIRCSLCDPCICSS